MFHDTTLLLTPELFQESPELFQESPELFQESPENHLKW